ncbi:phosphoribosylglycinamide formyltransferase [Sulfitobacter sp. JBTF-M27]|uniref:Phosphoribosylglycinamide formyltransferase n=1 Tax=Sulfitobacter sediminilitoris TaxID=2698830 RepID=A0A6P0C6F9_9RHOB|nr:phosphoribosylglycinamide formyltransferase [Sulfitobacter sediminilitoris]NEK20845.1 phosphoribosylglycinamide formyltransferase [Sulfitobacter sediminilitoris]
MTKRVAIFLSGGGSNMRALVEDMTGDHPARPCLVFSNQADAGGIAWAKERGIPTEVVDHRPYKGDRAAFEAAITEKITPYKPDIICLAGFMRKLTGAFTDQWAGRMINIHPSLLPKYRGLHTHARTLEAGDTRHGCTVHEVTAELDDGPILGQASLEVHQDDTPETLAARVLKLEHQLYPACLRRFAEGNREPLCIKA